MDRIKTTNLSNLPIELLEKIAKFLHTRLDTLRFRSVCTSFRSAAPAPPSPKFLSRKVPSPIQLNSTYHSDLQLTESTIYAIEPLGEAEILSNTTTTWFVKVQQFDSGKLLFREPLYNRSWTNKELSRRSQKLPKFINILNYSVREITKVYGLELVALNPNNKPPFGIKKPLDFKKVVVSKCFNETEDRFALMAIYNIDDDQVLGVWRYKDNKWTVKTWNAELYWDDIVYHNEKFYAFASEGCIFIIDPKSLEVTGHTCSVDNFDRNSYLVSSDEDLFMIQAYRHRNITFHARLCIFKFDEEKMNWVKIIDGFRDRVWFLGEDCSFSIPSNELSRFPRSCVFLAADDHSEMDYGFPGHNYVINYPPYDGGLYYLPDCLLIFWPPPAWAMLNSSSNL